MRIGIVTPWFERGIAYASLNMWQALSPHHDVFVLAKPGPKPVGSEWDVPNLEWGSSAAYGMPLAWAQAHDLDVLVFNERLDSKRIELIRTAGIKTVCLHEWESVDPRAVGAMNAAWDGIIAPTQCAYDRFVEIGLGNIFHVPWGTNVDLFRPPDVRANGPVRFFQPATFGGMSGRKNVKATRQAWAKADPDDATLMFAVQRKGSDTKAGSVSTLCGTRPRQELIGFYQQADVVLLPSQWEGIGLCFMEAMACGCAVVTVGAPPMCSYVVDGLSGWICKAHMRSSPARVHVQRAMIDVSDYAYIIECLVRMPWTVHKMGKVSRALATQRHDWKKNSIALVRAIEEIAA